MEGLEHITDRERLCYLEGMREAFTKLAKVVEPEYKDKINRHLRLCIIEILQLSNKIDEQNRKETENL